MGSVRRSGTCQTTLINTYDIDNPPVVMVYLENEPKNGVGPHDVALALQGSFSETVLSR